MRLLILSLSLALVAARVQAAGLEEGAVVHELGPEEASAELEAELKASSLSRKYLLNAPGCGLFETQRIFGGTESSAEAWPWQASLLVQAGNRWRRFCGGSLITEVHVLTAAHCVEQKLGKRLAVRLGNHEFESLSVTSGLRRDRPVKRIIIHKGYSNQTLKNDIAILRLKEAPKDARAHNTVCLPTDPEELYADSEAVAIGHGLTSGSNRSSGSTALLEASVMVFTDEHCEETFPTMAIGQSQLCAGSDEDEPRGICQGDSGGPLMVAATERSYVAVGIASFTPTICDHNGGVGGFTRTSAFWNWIRKNTRT